MHHFLACTCKCRSACLWSCQPACHHRAASDPANTHADDYANPRAIMMRIAIAPTRALTIMSMRCVFVCVTDNPGACVDAWTTTALLHTFTHTQLQVCRARIQSCIVRNAYAWCMCIRICTRIIHACRHACEQAEICSALSPWTLFGWHYLITLLFGWHYLSNASYLSDHVRAQVHGSRAGASCRRVCTQAYLCN